MFTVDEGRNIAFNCLISSDFMLKLECLFEMVSGELSDKFAVSNGFIHCQMF